MKKYLFYINDEGNIQCLYAETTIEMIGDGAEDIKVFDADSYESALIEYKEHRRIKDNYISRVIDPKDHMK